MRTKVVSLYWLDRKEEAEKAAEQLLILEPNLTINGWLDTHPAASFKSGRDWAEALRASGVPES